MVGLAMRLGNRRVSDLMSATLHDVTSFEEVKKKLLIYETRDQHAGVKSEPPVRRNPGEVACGAKYLKGKRCGYCNKKGHSENDCMTKQRDEDKSDGVVRCYYCQKRGHIRREYVPEEGAARRGRPQLGFGLQQRIRRRRLRLAEEDQER